MFIFTATNASRICLAKSIALALCILAWLGEYSQNYNRVASCEDKVAEHLPRIVAYLPDYRMDGFDPSKLANVTHLILFSAAIDGDGGLNTRRLNLEIFDRIVEQALNTRNVLDQPVRVALGVGGWGRSDHFAEVAKDDRLRKKFVDSAMEFCVRHRLNGIDLDWEHPKDASEENAYVRLIRDLHAAGQQIDIAITLTMAPWQNIDAAVFQHLDAVQIMSYDHPGRHSTFDQSIKDLEQVIAKGVPQHLAVLGLPLYGRKIDDSDTALTIAELIRKLKARDADRVSPIEGSANQDNGDEIDGYYFNGWRTIERKVEAVSERGMAGIMFWELGQDASGADSLVAKTAAKVKKMTWPSK